MKTTKEMIEIMTAYDNGAEIEYLEWDDYNGLYQPTTCPAWDWYNIDYQIKEQKKTITIEKWLYKEATGYSTLEVSSEIAKDDKDRYIKLLETYEVEL